MKSFLLSLAILIGSLSTMSQSHWSFELHGGAVWNVPMPLIIRQQGQPDIHLTARYSTEPFVLPVYYDFRISRWDDDHSWEAEFIHHKLYLQNTTSEVQKFNISHGFNLLFINRGFNRQTYRYRAGAGVVIAHPENEVRELAFGNSTKDNDWGYYLSGPALQASVNKPFHISRNFYLNAEAKTTLAYTRVKVAQGDADVYSLVFHLLIGVGGEGFKKD